MMKLPIKLIHYSGMEIKKLEPEYPYTLDRPILNKPFGLWISVEDYPDDETWKTWCEAEQFRLEGLKFQYMVKLKPDANVILLDTAERVAQFGIDHEDKNNPFLPKSAIFGKPYISYLDWLSIMKGSDGIIITPYQNQCRGKRDCVWYWGWDCSSGCIWNINCIEKFTLEET